MDKTIGISELRKSMASKIKEVHEKGSRYIIMQRSKAKAVLLSPKEIEILEVMADKNILKDIKRAKNKISQGQFTTYEKFFGKKTLERKNKYVCYLYKKFTSTS